MRKYIIVDIDNCLVDSRPIEKFLPTDRNSREQWSEYHKHYREVIENSVLIDLVLKYTMSDRIYPIFLTAREDVGECSIITQELLDKYFNKYTLHMRPFDDFRPDVEVKEDILKDYILNTSIVKDILFAIDDKPEICQMYNKYGIQTLCYKM